MILSSLFRAALNPTTSLYLMDAMAPEIRPAAWKSLRSGPNSFLIANALILIRKATSRELELARRQREKGGKVIYVIDDDFESMMEDPNQPSGYRRRLRRWWERGLPGLHETATSILVSSDALKDRFAGLAPTTRVDPYWPIETRPARPAVARPFTVAWLGSRSHTEDLASIAAELADFLRAHPNAALFVPACARLPAPLNRLPTGIVRRGPRVDWPAYRDRLRTIGLDVGIYPLLDTPVNRARSINKVLEHAWCDVPGLYSPEVPFAKRIQEAGGGWLVSRGEWAAALHRIAGSDAERSELLQRSSSFARDIAGQARKEQLAFWSGQLKS